MKAAILFNLIATQSGFDENSSSKLQLKWIFKITSLSKEGKNILSTDFLINFKMQNKYQLHVNVLHKCKINKIFWEFSVSWTFMKLC